MVLLGEIEKPKTPFFRQLKGKGLELIYKPLGIKTFVDAETLIKLSSEQFDSAQHSIQMVEEKFSSHIYNDSQIIRSIRDAINRDVKIQLICGPEFDPRNIELIKLIRNQHIDLFQLDKNPQAHFNVIDWVSTKLENPHGNTESFREGYFVQSMSLGNTHATEFNTLLALTQQKPV